MKKSSMKIVIAAIVAVSVLEIFFASELKATEWGNTVYEILVRAIGIAAFLEFIFKLGYQRLFRFRNSLKPSAIIFLAVSLLVAINNFPFAAVLSGSASLRWDWGKVLSYALICIFVGAFEEISFRGFLFPLLFERMKKTKLGVFLAILFSSLIFGAIHFVNIFAGADPVAVLLQIGYAALIGGLTSVVLLKTRNLWYCIILHSLYNFNGGLVDRIGSGEMWIPSQIALTATVAVLVAAYVIWQFCKLTDEEIGAFLKREKETIC